MLSLEMLAESITAQTQSFEEVEKFWEVFSTLSERIQALCLQYLEEEEEAILEQISQELRGSSYQKLSDPKRSIAKSIREWYQQGRSFEEITEAVSFLHPTARPDALVRQVIRRIQKQETKKGEDHDYITKGS